MRAHPESRALRMLAELVGAAIWRDDVLKENAGVVSTGAKEGATSNGQDTPLVPTRSAAGRSRNGCTTKTAPPLKGHDDPS